MLKRSEIDATLADERGNGLWAQFDDDDCLTHIGYYRDGRPASECWSITIDNEKYYQTIFFAILKLID